MVGPDERNCTWGLHDGDIGVSPMPALLARAVFTAQDKTNRGGLTPTAWGSNKLGVGGSEADVHHYLSD